MARYDLYIDGACYLCSFEARLIRRHDREKLFNFRNIADPSTFVVPPGMTHEEFDSKLHMFDYETQHWILGVDATITILKTFAATRWFGAVLSLPGVHFFAHLGYQCFAKIRSRLPKRSDCSL